MLFRSEKRVAGWPTVREAYAVSGEADFMLKLVARSLGELQDFIIRELAAAPNVENVKTSLVLRTAKCEPGIPLP